MSLQPSVVFGQFTSVEQSFLSTLAGLSYSDGDILYYDSGSLTNLPIGATGQVLTISSGGLPEWETVAGTGDVTAASAFATDNVLIRADGTGKGVQASGIVIDDSDNVSGLNSLNVSEVAAPATPAAGTVVIYAKTDGKLYIKDDTGSETELTSGGAGIIDGDKGDITVSASGATWTIDNDAVTYAKIQNVSAADRILGRISAGAGIIEELTAANVRTILNVADGATANPNALDNVVEDTSPQLGGNLDAQNFSIQNLTDVETDTVTADSSSGLVLRNSGGATVLTLGAGVGTGATFAGGVNTGALGVTGNISVSGTVDGRDIASDGTKLDGIEAGADVTDTANVTAAGALMDSEVANLAAVKAFDPTDYIAATGDTMEGDLNMGGNDLLDVHETRLDGTPDTDHSANGPTTNTFNAGTTIAAGDIVYLASDGEWALADADGTATAEALLGVALESGTDGNPLLVALPGSFVRDDTWNWTVGAQLYLSLTAGDLSEAVAATATDDVSRVCGYAVSADVIYWFPQQGVVHA